jgi:hypothetical protein
VMDLCAKPSKGSGGVPDDECSSRLCSERSIMPAGVKALDADISNQNIVNAFRGVRRLISKNRPVRYVLVHIYHTGMDAK